MTFAIVTTAVLVGGAVYLLVKSPSAPPTSDVRSASLEIVHVSVWSDDRWLKGLETNYAAVKTIAKTEKQVNGLPATIYYG